MLGFSTCTTTTVPIPTPIPIPIPIPIQAPSSLISFSSASSPSFLFLTTSPLHSYLHGRLLPSLHLLDWHFLESGRLFARFPHLTEIDIVRSCLRLTPPYSGVFFITFKPFFSLPITTITDHDKIVGDMLPPDRIYELIAHKYPNLRRISVFGASEYGLASLADTCQTLQELELHCCGDLSLKGVSGCVYLQVMKLSATRRDGFFTCVVSDIGLTILAQG